MLIFALGNPVRGDDALGWHFSEHAQVRWSDLIAAGALEVLTEFQLQVEHALDLADRERVLFVDASVSAPAPFALAPVGAEAASPLSHALSPAALMRTVDDLGQARPACVEVLAIRGELFELGTGLSADAAQNLDEALRRVDALLGLTAEDGLRVRVTGTVQGVGFRPFVARSARRLGLTGQVKNLPDAVLIEVWGPIADLDTFARTVLSSPPPSAVVRAWSSTALSGTAPTTFEITASEPGAVRLSIPPDLALCPACRAELADPADRHFDHPFTSCVDCGPRLSIATSLPYDRANTTMASFGMCHECASEYANHEDRRYHAQAIACPACGPTLTLCDKDREVIARPLDAAAAMLRAGEILAVEGLGGFHLACDATSARAVSLLRERKRRDMKPFAVMVADLSAAGAIAELDPDGLALLASRTGPIVLAKTREDPRPALAPNVACGSPRVGVFLPTTPMHAALLSRVSPLVMTSGNLSGEPVALTHDDAFSTLSEVADAFLMHDRPIVRRVEDSVVSLDPRLPRRVVRRARGYAPRPMRLPVTAPEPILALGGHMKNTAAIVIGDECWLTPHLGDLDTHAAELAWIRDVEGFEALLGVRCELLVHDAHPDYTTTRYAERRTDRRLAVQHHHAHVLAVLAERRTLEPVLALAFDGTGWGPDQTAWGGEVLRVDGLSMSRPSAFRPIPLPGGERAIGEVWRAAYGALFDTFGPAHADLHALITRLPTFAGPRGADLLAVHDALTRGVGVVHARGLGRLFDAVGSLVLGRATASYEGELPMRLEDLATLPARPYPFAVPRHVSGDLALSEDQEIDLRPTWRALVDDLLSQVAPAVIASRLHATIVAATLATIEHHGLASGVRKIVLTGGSFQNRVLEHAFRDALGDVVLDPIEVPVNDGGLALGQALAGALHLIAENGGR